MSDYAKLIYDHLSTFLERHRQQAELVPLVQRALNEASWQLHAVTLLNTVAPDDVRERIDRDLSLSYTQLSTSLPLPAQYGALVFSAVATGVTSSSSAVFEAVRGALTFPEHHSAAAQCLADYGELQRQDEREATVRRVLVRRFTTAAAQFDTAAKTCLAAQADPTHIAAAANEARNLLDRFKGDLFEAARRHRGENMTWERMTERLVPGAMPSSTRPIVLVQEHARARLYDSLSAILKKREATEPTKIEYLWAETLDHLYVVCTAIGDGSA